MKRVPFVLMFVGAFAIAGYGLSYFFGLPFRIVDHHFFEVRHLLYPHVLGGAIALLTGPWQFSKRLRTRRPQWHRVLGYTYVSAVLIGGVFGLALARQSMGGVMTHLGFGVLAVAWITTTLIAVQQA